MSDTSSVEGRLRWKPPLDVRTRLAGPSIVLLAFASSFTGLTNGFAFDDLPIIAQDGRIHRLEEPWRFFVQPYWGPPAPPALYRPLISLAFALQWNLGNGSALPYHVVNVVLYAVVCLAVYRLAVALLGRPAGWWSAALFAVHPVHTEVVANSVGQSELWAGFLVILAVLCYVRYRRRGDLARVHVMLLALLYLAACLFKEHAIMLPALLVLAELILFGGSLSATLRRGDLRGLWCTLAIVAIGFWTAHAVVIGDLAGDRPNRMFWGMGFRDRLFTMLGIVPEWFRLLLLPARLKVEYLPQEVHRAYAFRGPQLLGSLIVAVIACAAVVLARRVPIFTFGVLWTGATLLPVSNVIVTSGVVLAERTLFLPSVGVVLALGTAIAWAAHRVEGATPLGPLATAMGVAVLLAGVVRSAIRQPVWRDDRTYHDQLLLDAPRSYRAQWTRGLRLFAARDAAGGEEALRRAVELFPDDPQVLAQLADRYRSSNRCQAAVPLYRHSLAIDRSRSYLRERLIRCLIRLDRLHEAQEEVAEALARGEARARQDSALVSRAVRSRARPPDSLGLGLPR